MVVFLNKVLSFLPALPPLSLSISIVLILSTLGFILIYEARRRLYRKAILCIDNSIYNEKIQKRILASPSLSKKLFRHKGNQAIIHFSLQNYLFRRIEKKNETQTLNRLFDLIPEKTAFPAFLLALKKPLILKTFRKRLECESPKALFRWVALGAQGHSFSFSRAWELFSAYQEDFQNLLTDHQWEIRLFALRLFLAQQSPATFPLLRESWDDPHPLIREHLTRAILVKNADELFSLLRDRVLNDSMLKIRQVARERLETCFPHRWRINPALISPLQILHVLSLLQVDSQEDKNLAFHVLEGKTQENDKIAAHFLEKAGTLHAFFNGADRADSLDWKRRCRLLKRAHALGISSFLKGLDKTDNSSLLLLALRLLEDNEDPEVMLLLSKKAFASISSTHSSDQKRFCHEMLSLACGSEDEKIQQFLCAAVKKHRHDTLVLTYMLPLFQPERVSFFRRLFIDLLYDPLLPTEKIFVSTLSKLPPEPLLEPVLSLLESTETRLRLRALQCLGAWHLDETIAHIMENLPLIPLSETRDYAQKIDLMDHSLVEEWSTFILDSPDGQMRAALISCLPKRNLVRFEKKIIQGLKDNHPPMRLACWKALALKGPLSPALYMRLNDPEDEGQQEAVELWALSASSQEGSAILENFLNDSEKPWGLKKKIIEGLGVNNPFPILLNFLEKNPQSQQKIIPILILSTQKSEQGISFLLDRFKNANDTLKNSLIAILKAMGNEGEEKLMLLTQKGAFSDPLILGEIFKRTGLMEKIRQQIHHHKVKQRRKAAEIVAALISDEAYRVVIMALHDPDHAVRSTLLPHFRSLLLSKGRHFLKELENDPNPQIRTRLQWAREHWNAKKTKK